MTIRVGFWRALVATIVAMVTALATQCAPVLAQAAYPSRAIKILVGFGPGGATDLLARAVAQKLSEQMGQPVVVENRPGAGSMLAGELVARAAPDGYALLMGPSGPIVFAPAVYSKMPYDPIKSFAPIGIVASYPLVLVVSAEAPIKSVAELVAYTKAHPDKSNYASSSALFQLSTELFKVKTGAQLEHIPFKGSLDGTTAIIKGEVLMALIDPGPVVPFIASGKLRLLAHSAPKRRPEFPDTPTLAELGVDEVVEVFAGVLAPAGTPPDIVARLEKEFEKMRAAPDFVAQLRSLSLPVAGGSAAEFTQVIAREVPQWQAVAKAANIKLD